MSDALEAAAVALATCDALEYEDAARAAVLAFLDAVDAMTIVRALEDADTRWDDEVGLLEHARTIRAALKAKASADAGSHTSQK